MANLNKTQNEKMQTINRELDELRSLVPDESRMKIDLSSPNLRSGKLPVEFRSVNFQYSGSNVLWRDNLNLTIRSGDRIRVTGRNGQGKTILLKMITGELAPDVGTVSMAGDLSCIYLDQEYNLINDHLTIYEQLASETSTMTEHELKIGLHRFLFPQSTWDKKCSILSGGDKMRLAICSLMVRDLVPDMIIVDEPTNNIDIANKEILATTLRSFQGTLVVISHDKTFISEIDIKSEINLS